jgi:hypothetical protein
LVHEHRERIYIRKNIILKLAGHGQLNQSQLIFIRPSGLVHLLVSLTGLFGGYAFLKRRPILADSLAINGATIAYSAFSESLPRSTPS